MMMETGLTERFTGRVWRVDRLGHLHIITFSIIPISHTHQKKNKKKERKKPKRKEIAKRSQLKVETNHLPFNH